MASFTGYSPMEGLPTVPVVGSYTRCLDVVDFNYVNGDLTGETLVDLVAASSDAGGGVATDNTPISVRVLNHIGHKPISFFNDFYNRIILDPQLVEFGNLLSDQQRTISAWNGNFTPVTMASVSPDSVDGVTLTSPTATPTYYAPLGGWDYILSVGTKGPPNVSTSYTFDFTYITSLLTITGQRLLVWPFAPNWDKPV